MQEFKREGHQRTGSVRKKTVKRERALWLGQQKRGSKDFKREEPENRNRQGKNLILEREVETWYCPDRRRAELD